MKQIEQVKEDAALEILEEMTEEMRSLNEAIKEAHITRDLINALSEIGYYCSGLIGGELLSELCDELISLLSDGKIDVVTAKKILKAVIKMMAGLMQDPPDRACDPKQWESLQLLWIRRLSAWSSLLLALATALYQRQRQAITDDITLIFDLGEGIQDEIAQARQQFNSAAEAGQDNEP